MQRSSLTRADSGKEVVGGAYYYHKVNSKHVLFYVKGTTTCTKHVHLKGQLTWKSKTHIFPLFPLLIRPDYFHVSGRVLEIASVEMSVFF